MTTENEHDPHGILAERERQARLKERQRRQALAAVHSPMAEAGEAAQVRRLSGGGAVIGRRAGWEGVVASAQHALNVTEPSGDGYFDPDSLEAENSYLHTENAQVIARASGGMRRTIRSI